MSTCRRMKLDMYVSTTIHKNQLQVCQRLMCMKSQTLKLLEKNIGSALKGMDRGKAFLTRRTPFTQELMLTDKWELIKLQISV